MKKTLLTYAVLQISSLQASLDPVEDLPGSLNYVTEVSHNTSSIVPSGECTPSMDSQGDSLEEVRNLKIKSFNDASTQTDYKELKDCLSQTDLLPGFMPAQVDLSSIIQDALTETEMFHDIDDEFILVETGLSIKISNANKLQIPSLKKSLDAE